MYIMAPEPISAACFINPFHQSVCLYVYPPIVAMQRLDIRVPPATNTRNKELLDASFSVLSITYQKRVCGSVCVSPIVAKEWLGKHVLAATKNC
jgi:hypothetical protein